MPRPIPPPSRRLAHIFSRMAPTAVAVGASLATLGWLAGTQGIVLFGLDLSRIDSRAAVGVGLAALTVRLTTSRPSRWGRLLLKVGAALVFLTGLLGMAVKADAAESAAFALLGISTACLDWHGRRGWWGSQMASALAASIGLIALSGFALGAPREATSPLFQQFSGVSALSLILVAISLLAARPDGQLTWLVFDPGLAGDSIRLMVPIAMVIPFALGWLRLWGQRQGLYTVEYGVALMDVGTTLALVVGVWLSARMLAGAERARARAEQGRAESERRLRMMLDVSEVGVWERDVLLNRMECDATTYRLWGMDPDTQPTFATMMERIHPEDRARVQEEVERALMEGAEYDTTYRILLPEGSERALGARGAVTLDPDGRPMRITGVNWDMTRELHAEEARDRARREQLEMKDQFISHASHELRSPISAISEFQDILLRGIVGPLSAAQRECVEIAQRNAYQLRLMIDDLLEVTRAQAGKLTVEPCSFAVEGIIEEIVNTLTPAASLKGIGLSHSLYDPPPLAFADPARVRQVIVNLVENAIKFTPSGGTISISAEVDAAGDHVDISVEDTGSGISPEDQTRIFEHLFQAGNDSRESRKGLGLGLYICRELVTRMGGQIRVDSLLGRGSRFTFSVPLASLAVATETRRSA